MEFKMNPRSSKTMNDLLVEFTKEEKKKEEMEKARRREMENKQREFDRSHGFKSRYEIVKYLKDGNVIGVFNGLFGENDQTNNFFYWDVEDGVIKHHFQESDGYDCNFFMTTHNVNGEELAEWLNRLEELRTKDGFYPTEVLRKTGTKRKEVYEMFDLIDEILKSRNK